MEEGPAPSTGRRYGVGLLVVSAVGMVVRLWSVATVARHNPTAGDGFYYHAQANMLARGHWFVDPYRSTAGHLVPGNAHPPLYTLWLSVSSFLGGTDFRAHKTMSCLAGVLLIVGLAQLVRELAGNRAGLIAAALAAFYPPFWVISGLLMPEELYAALMAWTLAFILRWTRRPRLGTAVAVGATLGLATMTRAEAVIFVPLLVVPVMVLYRRSLPAWRPRLVHAAVAVAAFGVVIAPWVVRSAVTYDRFEPFSTNGDELFVYANNPMTYGISDETVVCSRPPADPAHPPEGQVLRPQGSTYLGYWYFPWEQYLRCEHGEAPGDASEQALYWREQGLDYMKAHKGRLPVVMAARVGRTWEVFRPFQNAVFGQVEGRTYWVSRLGLFAWWAMWAGAVAGVVVLRRRRVPIWPLLSMAVGVTLTVVYAYGNERFRLPLDVAVVAGSAVALDALLRLRWPVAAGTAGPLERAPERGAGPPGEDGGADDEALDRAVGPPSGDLTTAGEWLRERLARVRHWPWRDIAMWAVVALVLAIPFRGLMKVPGGPMEEGFMLTFPERILHGDLPNRDFLHLYGPGSLWVLAALYWLFGTSVATERLFGAVQVTALAAGVVWLLRPFGRYLAALGGVVSLVVVVPALGFTALAWNGGVALVLLSVALALAIRRGPAEHEGRLLWAGVLAGVALLFRADLVLAGTLAAAGALWGMPRRQVRRYVTGALVGVSPILVHLATAGPGHVVNGMFIDPVFRLRGGRTLPIPPSWSELQVYMQRLAAYIPMPWSFPHLPIAAEVAAWFWLVPLVAIALVGSAYLAWRREPATARSRTLVVGALLAVGMLPQSFQRADVPHFAWASCVSLAVLPAAVASLLGAPGPSVGGAGRAVWRPAAGTAVVAVILLSAIPLLTSRPYTEIVRVATGRQVGAYPIRRHDRTFPYGSPEAARAGNALVAELDRRARPGQRLFVGPVDLRRTPYSQAFWYFLFPDLVPATYYIEQDPWIANRPGSGLADDVRSADWLILTSIGSGWDEPNLSRRLGSDEPNEVVRRDFCLIDTYGGRVGTPEATWSLYGRCTLVGRAPGGQS